ncbi:MAG: pyridoxine 5'-phosphate synthase [Opitutales bacterium]|nr:pyridoxine 5'-phosphate synthase [Opitutales bacterium]
MAASSILLGVNIDHSATLREARFRAHGGTCGGVIEPDPVTFALYAEKAGADSITIHPREDARHIRRDDVRRLRAVLQVPLNMEMACTADMIAFAREIRPAHVCVVPESREEVTTEGGLNAVALRAELAGLTAELAALEIAVSLFIDPEPEQIEAAAAIKCPYIELHTGAFANAYYDLSARASEIERLRKAAILGHEAGIGVNIGHGINYTNVRHVRDLPHINEMNIGHSIVSRSLFTGVDAAVREMKRLIQPEQ